MTISEYNQYFVCYKKMIERYKISKLLRFSPELMDNLADNCILGKQFKINYHRHTSYYIINFIFAVIYNAICRVFLSKSKIHSGIFNCIFIKGPSVFNRFGKLSYAIENSLVCTVPIFDLFDIRAKHSKESKESANSTVLLLSPKDVFLTLAFALKNIRHLYILGKNKDCCDTDFNPNKYLLVFILKYTVCLRSISHLTSTITDSHNPTIITDHDKTPIVFALKHIRETDSLNFKLITINHGAFSGFNLTYTKPYSDLIMCTCPREIELTKKYSGDCMVFDYGVQLSTFLDNEIESAIEPMYDLLILGTTTENETGIKQIELIKYLKTNKINFKYRLRPNSAIIDKQYLSKVLTDDDYTKGTSLLEDCISSKKIISFSLDALGRAAILKKPIAIYVDEQVFFDFSPIGQPSSQIFITANFKHISDFIDLTVSDTTYDSNTEKWVYNNIGELNFDNIVKKIKSHI